MNPSISPKVSTLKTRRATLRASLARPTATEPNPILRREVQARWRRWPAFVVVLIYAALLSGAVVFRYEELSHTTYDVGQTAQLGHELFAFMLQLQILGWLLLAPLLTATSITTERERGTMLSLHLSGLTPRQIAWGKFTSALGFVALLLLAPLPVVAVCFLLGGITPWEFLGAFALQAATAAVGAAIGLACSARQNRAGAAIGGAMAVVAAWNLLPPVALLSPCFAASLLLNAQTDTVAITVLVLSLLLGPAAVVILLNDATASLYRPLPPAMLQPKIDPFKIPTTAPEGPVAPNPRGDWKRLPLVGRIAFDNPVLQREIRIKLQVREGSLGSKGNTPAGLVLFLVVFFSLFALMLIVGESGVRFATWNTFTYCWLIATLGMTALWSSSAFTREREAGMLSSLRLSLLTRGDILSGKAVAPLLALAYYSLSMLPVLLPCLRGVSRGGIGATGVPLTQALATLLLIVGASWMGTVVGLVWSWYARSGWIATAGSLGSGFFLLAGTLLGGGDALLAKAQWWHPVVALHFVNNTAEQKLALQTAAVQCAFWIVLGVAALIPVWIGLGRVTSEVSQTTGS